MGKIAALDLGDAWIGSALSDALHMLARPYKTVTTAELLPFLTTLLKEEPIETVVVGYPKTMGGLESAQTLKVKAVHEELIQQFPNVSFILWDERLSSKRAETLTKRSKSPQQRHEEKVQSHSRAAAFILDSYLQYKAQQRLIYSDDSDQ